MNLSQLLHASRVEPREALAIVPQIYDALQFAHGLGIVHRDIKPESILMDRRGRVKAADFGLAKIVGDVAQTFVSAGSGDFPVASSTAGNTGLESPVNPQAGKPALQPDDLTGAGRVMGTPQCISPERIEAPRGRRCSILLYEPCPLQLRCRAVRDTWLLVDSGPGAPAFNMALDEALLMTAPDGGRPVLRFYGWTEPAATFGYFQRITEVEQATVLRPLVRRPTGGGIVPHGADWTYSVIIPTGHEWHRLKAAQSYRRVHKWIRAAFQQMGVATELALDSRKPAPGQCFAGHEVHDVLWQERKIAGAAQRRTRTGLLIQGSVQPPPVKLDRNAWQQAMCEVLDATWMASIPTAAVMNRASRLAREKYTTDAYNRKR